MFVSVPESVTGEEINTDAPLGEVKTTIRGLASRQSVPAELAASRDAPRRRSPYRQKKRPLPQPTMDTHLFLHRR